MVDTYNSTFRTSKNQSIKDQFIQALKELKLDNKIIQYIQKNSDEKNYIELYRQILHVILLYDLRTKKKGEVLQHLLFQCWNELFANPSKRSLNEHKLHESLQMLVEHYSLPSQPHFNLQKKSSRL